MGGVVCGADTERSDWPRDVLQHLVADVLEAHRQLVADVIPYRPRNNDSAGLGQSFEAGRNIDAIAKDVIGLDNDIAEVDADAEGDFLVGLIAAVSLGGALLDLDRATQRFHDTDEFRQQAIAGFLDQVPCMRLDRWFEQLAEQRNEARVCTLLIAAHQAAVTGHIGAEDRGQLAFQPAISRDYAEPRWGADVNRVGT